VATFYNKIFKIIYSTFLVEDEDEDEDEDEEEEVEGGFPKKFRIESVN
jgi:hypothetical protein